MDLDDYLSRLNNDLESQLSRFNQSFSPDTSSAEENVSVSESLFCSECGFKNPASAKFCCNCGSLLDDNYSDDARENEECDCDYTWDCQGILYTNTAILAEKYNCEPEDVFNVLDRFCEVAQTDDMYWFLVDAKDYDIEDYDNWLEHNKLISRIIKDNELASGIKAPLFIIGGHDVVPIPMVNDVFGTADDGYIPCYMCYCFEGDFINEMWEDGDCCLDESCVRNNVSRLPLEDGELDSSLDDDLEAYLGRCSNFYDDGIEVSDVMMTANASWLPASKTMSEHLPLLHHSDDPEMVQDDMYVSPPVSTNDEDSMEPVNETLGGVEMLLFNLHGTDSSNEPGFYNDEDEAFNIDMLAESNALVFNTVACFGARYHGYSRDESMLLSSLYEHKFLLYVGSLIAVPMTHLNVPEGVEVHDGSGSEHLMPIFCMEQFSGIPMGEAMMRAKLEYFNTFRHMERDDFSLATIMMFSLYGNPMLRMQRSEEVLRRAKEEHVLPILPQANKKMPIRRKLTERVFTNEKDVSSSLLDQIRGHVDSNIEAIHQTLQKHLYDQLGLEPRWLTHVDSFSIPNGDGSYEVGYSYAYDDKSRHYGGKQWVETDTSGDVKRVITTK